MFDLFYVALAAAGYFVYTQVTSDPSPQLLAEEAKIAIKPQPRIAYHTLDQLLAQKRPNVVVVGKSADQGWLGTPRYDLMDQNTGIITPVYTTDINKTLSLLQI